MRNILTLSLLFIGLGGFAQKITLILNLKQDSTYYLNTNTNMTIVEDLPGETQVITMLLNYRVSHKVMAIHDSVYEMDVAYKKMGMHMEVGGKTIGFSSDDSLGSNPASKMIASLLNKPFTMIIDQKRQSART